MSKANINHAEIISWAKSTMRRYGYDIQRSEEVVVDTPWSVVIRFFAKQGSVYLKQTPPDLFIESNILTALREVCHVEHIPELIGSNEVLRCFLMKDAGQPLRQTLKQKFDSGLLCKTISQFKAIQLMTSDHINIFLDMGVPDWRLDKLPALYIELISQKDILIEGGLSEEEMSELEALLPKVSNLCDTLSDYSIKQGIVQPDFHDNNVLIDAISGKITFIDLGEIVISHPFFSLVNCLRQVKKHHGLGEEDAEYQRIMDACFKDYLNHHSRDYLLEAFTVTQLLSIIYGALGDYRLMVACGKETLRSSRHGKPVVLLKKFISACAGVGQN